MKSSTWTVPLAGAIAALALATTFASAEPRWGGPHGGEHGPRGGGHGEYFDRRFSHNQYYPSRGYAVGELPGQHIVVERGGGRYYYSGGVWYRPWGPRFVVVAAPIGVFVPILPPFYTTVWFGGFPYYYANDTYYLWRESAGQYEVVAPPGEESAATAGDAPSDAYVYPRNGQSEEQQSQDRYECHRWAMSQSGFDPKQSGGGVAPDESAGKHADYQRAFGACLDGRGYSVK